MPVPAFTSVVTPRLTIRPLREADLPDLLEINGDPEVTGFLPYATWQSLDDGAAWMQRMAALALTGTGQQFVLELNASRKVVGTLLFFRFDEGSARAELGYVLGQRYWKTGLMREALQGFCTHAFGDMGVRRLEAEVNPSNQPSNALLRRIGFTLEGTLRQRWVAKGKAYDTHLYGLLAPDWQQAFAS